MQKLGICFIVHNFEISVKVWVSQQYFHFLIYMSAMFQFVEGCNCNSICCSCNYWVYICHYCHQKSSDTMWFVKITKKEKAANNIFNKYGHSILEGDTYIEGKYLEFELVERNVNICEEINK